MPSASNFEDNREIVLKATLILVAVAINSLEMFLPRIPVLPWLKPGLANCVTVFWLIRFGSADALLFSLLRIWLVSFYFGFSFVTLMLGLSGGLFSMAAMSLVWRFSCRGKYLGTVGVAIIGALCHNLGQVAGVYVLLAGNVALLYQIPFMIAASVLFGGLVGLITPHLFHLAEAMNDNPGPAGCSLPENHGSSDPKHILASVGMLALSTGLMFIDAIHILLAIALAVTVAVRLTVPFETSTLLFPVRRFPMMFLFVACFHLFPAYGEKIPWLPLISWEGAVATLVQVLRLWTWLQLSLLMTYTRSHILIFKTLGLFFRPHARTFYAGLLAVEHFPAVFESIRKRAAVGFHPFLRHPAAVSKNLLHQTFQDVSDHVTTRTGHDRNNEGCRVRASE